MFERNVKEPFDRRRVEVDRDDPREASCLDEVGDDARSNGFPAGCTPILTGVSEVGHDGCQASRTGPAAGVGQKEQLDHMLVDRKAGRLNHIDVVSADALPDVYVQFTRRGNAE